MNKTCFFYIFLASVLALAASCKSTDDPEPTPPSAPAPRTVLVYMVANNNLGSNDFDAADIAEMKRAAKNGDIADGRMVVYHAGYNSAPVLMEITAGGADTLKIYDRSVLSVEAARMGDVFADLKKLAPADDYGLVLWSHGTGWIHDGIAGDSRKRSFGLENGRTMNTSTLASVIAAAPVDFSFLYFDCCYMMSVETLYELRNAVPLVAGSATELPSPGQRYDLNVSRFFAMPQADITGAATNTFNEYNSFFGSDRTCTMSVVNTAGIAALASATRAVYEACGGGIPAGYTPQRFSWTSVASCRYFDMRDYIHSLCESAGRDDLRTAFDEAFDAAVLYAAATPKLWNAVDLDRHNGISTFILTGPDAVNTGNYNQLEWYADVASAIKFE